VLVREAVRGPESLTRLAVTVEAHGRLAGGEVGVGRQIRLVVLAAGIVAGDEKEAFARLELELFGERCEEQDGLVVLLGLAGEADVAGDEDEVGTRPFVAELLDVTQKGLERLAAVPAFEGLEVESERWSQRMGVCAMAGRRGGLAVQVRNTELILGSS
jgi:hypothetical protein